MTTTPTKLQASLEQTMQQAQRFPILRQNDERELVERWHATEDPEAAERLLGSHLRLVIKIARAFRGYGLPLDELIAEGNVGMMQATAAARDPWLDANSERPIATYAAQAIDAQAEAARIAVLGELAKEAGILFFYQAGCPLCDSQAGVVKLASDIHGFEIVAVSLDGSPAAGGLELHRLDDGQAERLGVAALPATFLIRPPDLIAPLAQAPLDLQTLGRRIIGQAHAVGLVPDETYLATRAVRRPFELPTDLDDLSPEVMNDPARLVAHFRQKLGMPGPGDQ